MGRALAVKVAGGMAAASTSSATARAPARSRSAISVGSAASWVARSASVAAGRQTVPATSPLSVW
jgi:hypothetical protein